MERDRKPHVLRVSELFLLLSENECKSSTGSETSESRKSSRRFAQQFDVKTKGPEDLQSQHLSLVRNRSVQASRLFYFLCKTNEQFMIKRRCQHEAEGPTLIINSAAARFTAKSLNCERDDEQISI